MVGATNVFFSPYPQPSPVCYQENVYPYAFANPNYHLFNPKQGGLPANFDSRKPANMHYGEKVDTWMSCVPYHPHPKGGVYSECFPAVEPDSDINSLSSGIPEVIDLADQDSLLQLQAQKISRYTTRIYRMEQVPSTPPAASSSYYDDDIGMTTWENIRTRGSQSQRSQICSPIPLRFQVDA